MLADELVGLAEEQLAAQGPLAELLERDPAFAAWADRVLMQARVPLGLAVWPGDEPPPPELTAVLELSDRHDERLIDIVAEHGWPGRSLVGEDGADAAWLLAQHADRHHTARRPWHALLVDAVRLGEADPRHLARFADRLAMIDDEPQQYGTYCTLADGGEIAWDFPPEGTLADVDERRAAIGLPPLGDDLREPPGAGPYRYLRSTPAYRWPTRR